MHVLNQEIDLVFLDDVQCRVKKGDGISGNYFFKLYEYRDSLFALHFLRPGDCFVDVGANVGHYSLIAARKCAARVIAVEPVPDTFERLVGNIELNRLGGHGPGRIDARRIGLSNRKGVLSFTTSYYTSNRVTSEPTPHSANVEVTTLDELSPGERIRLLKIDVEGYEKFVLEGAERQLASESLDAVIIEINGSGRRFGVDDGEVVHLLEAYGFLPHNYDPFTRAIVPVVDRSNGGYNVIFIKDADRVAERVRLADPVRVDGRAI